MDRRRSLRRTGIACTLLVALLVLLPASCGIADGFFYRPDSELHATPATYGLDVEAVSFAAPGGPRLHGWWVPAPAPATGTVVYCHGNHRNLTWHARFVAWLPRRGFNLLVFDYRGYGQSDGSPSRAGTVADTLAAIDFALQRDPERTVLFGHSLGGAVGIVAAAERPAVRAVAVESSFPSYRAAARCSMPALAFLVPWLVSDGFDPEDALPRIPPRPLLVIHGSEDRITPLELGTALHEAAREPKQLRVAHGCAHESPWVAEGRAFEDDLCRFFAAALGR